MSIQWFECAALGHVLSFPFIITIYTLLVRRVEFRYLGVRIRWMFSLDWLKSLPTPFLLEIQRFLTSLIYVLARCLNAINFMLIFSKRICKYTLDETHPQKVHPYAFILMLPTTTIQKYLLVNCGRGWNQTIATLERASRKWDISKHLNTVAILQSEGLNNNLIKAYSFTLPLSVYKLQWAVCSVASFM